MSMRLLKIHIEAAITTCKCAVSHSALLCGMLASVKNYADNIDIQ